MRIMYNGLLMDIRHEGALLKTYWLARSKSFGHGFGYGEALNGLELQNLRNAHNDVRQKLKVYLDILIRIQNNRMLWREEIAKAVSQEITAKSPCKVFKRCNTTIS